MVRRLTKAIFVDGHGFPDLVGMNIACNEFIQRDFIKMGEMDQSIEIRFSKSLFIVGVCLSGNI